jgi:hypothetical protein
VEEMRAVGGRGLLRVILRIHPRSVPGGGGNRWVGSGSGECEGRGWHPSGVWGHSLGRFRWCRFARPPATFWDASGIHGECPGQCGQRPGSSFGPAEGKAADNIGMFRDGWTRKSPAGSAGLESEGLAGGLLPRVPTPETDADETESGRHRVLMGLRHDGHSHGITVGTAAPGPVVGAGNEADIVQGRAGISG